MHKKANKANLGNIREDSGPQRQWPDQKQPVEDGLFDWVDIKPNKLNQNASGFINVVAC